ncbi:MAG: riboflavin synthase [Candidatus Norongarragalinales archaeon]
MKKIRIGIADTTFARINMGEIAANAVKKSGESVEIIRRTLPGVKDLPVACKKMIEEEGCESVIACGWVGRQEIDKTCAHEAALGIIYAQLLTNKHILGAFVFENEAKNERELIELAEDRVSKHALNAINIALHPEKLAENAGKGLRQGSKHAGTLR